jgi:hypothetical protein
MNIYLVARTDKIDYDEFDAFIVAANTEEEARNTHPYDNNQTPEYNPWDQPSWSWITKKEIPTLKVTLIGTTTHYTEREVILSPFNAG